MANRRIPLLQRFWSQIDKTGEHWLWTGTTDGGGYGIIRRNGRWVGVHRLSWEIANGQEPTGVIRHACDIKLCVHPACLLDGTQKQNMEDKIRRERHHPRIPRAEYSAVVERFLAGEGVNTIARDRGVHWDVVNKVLLSAGVK